MVIYVRRQATEAGTGGGTDTIKYATSRAAQNVEGADNTVRTHSTTSITKTKQINIDDVRDTTTTFSIDTSFDLRAISGGLGVRAAIYRNAGLVGTTRDTTSTGFTTYTETISGWDEGDQYNLYTRSLASNNKGECRNFRLKGLMYAEDAESDMCSTVKQGYGAGD